MKPVPAALSLATLAFALLGCSLFSGPATSAVEATGEPIAEPPPASESPPSPTPEGPSPTPTAFVVVDPLPGEGDLAGVLADHASRAGELGLRPFVEFTASWCPSCNALAGSLDDPRMIEAFQEIYLIRLDIDEWERSLPGSGFRVFGVPTFFEVDGEGLPTGRMLTGAAWGRDVVENMAPVLKRFFAGG